MGQRLCISHVSPWHQSPFSPLSLILVQTAGLPGSSFFLEPVTVVIPKSIFLCVPIPFPLLLPFPLDGLQEQGWPMGCLKPGKFPPVPGSVGWLAWVGREWGREWCMGPGCRVCQDRWFNYCGNPSSCKISLGLKKAPNTEESVRLRYLLHRGWEAVSPGVLSWTFLFHLLMLGTPACG